MMRTVLASAALVAAVQAQSCGNAIVVNKCNYDVYMANTPAADGGYSAISKTLSSGATYSQQWTELTNGNGWSLKLSKDSSQWSSDIMQYEYTYHNDGIIWYDLSEVNGNPWNGNWEITATNGCTPKQSAYRYATDDAYGMQSCNSDASITVTLCSGSDNGNGGPSAPGASSPAASSPAWTSTTAAASPTTSTTQNWATHTWAAAVGNKVVAPAGDAVAPQESETSTADAWNGPAVTVTNVLVETKTAYVTATAAPAKRHEHHPRHPHFRR